MEEAILIVLLLVAAVAAALVVAALRRITKEDEQAIAEQQAAAAVEETVEEVAAAAPVETVANEESAEDDEEETEEIVAEEVDEATEEPTPEIIPEDAVVFSATRDTIDQRYEALPDEMKGYYDEIVKYAHVVEGNRRFKNDRYEEYKVGKNRIVRLLIKRGVIVCEFVIANSDLRNYMADNKLKIKQAATTMKVYDETTLQAAKNAVDIAVRAIEDEKQYKKEQARAKRRAAKAAAQEAETAPEVAE